MSGKRKSMLVAAVGAVLGLGAAQAQAAAIIDLQVMDGSIPAGHTATIAPGDTVTLGIYISNVSGQGLGGFGIKIGSFSEQTDGVAWPVARTPIDTVLNATGKELATLDSKFTLAPTSGSLIDLSTADLNDTDIDLSGMGASMSPGTFTYGLGQATPYLVGFVTYTALVPNTRAYPQTVHLSAIDNAGNTLFGSSVKYITATGGLSNDVLQTSTVADAVITVAPSTIPLPASALAGFVGLGLVGWVSRRRATR